MRILLDENIPRQLKSDFRDFEIFTVRDKGWEGVKNGVLLGLMLENNFDALITFDKNLQHQQNFSKYSIAVFVLNSSINTYIELTKLTPQIKDLINKGNLQSGPLIIK